MKQAIWQSIAILVVSSVFGAASFFVRPEALPESVSKFGISLSDARDLPNAIWIDARMDADYEASHLDGALLLNEENWEAGFVPLLGRWVPGTAIVVYCSSQSCLRSHHVAERLREELGSEEVYALTGGWEALLEAGIAGEKATR